VWLPVAARLRPPDSTALGVGGPHGGGASGVEAERMRVAYRRPPMPNRCDWVTASAVYPQSGQVPPSLTVAYAGSILVRPSEPRRPGGPFDGNR
jgi:hypothetical protein